MQRKSESSLIIGAGEIGRALHKVLSKKYKVTLKDKEEFSGHYDIVHICFPYSDNFISEVKRYQKLYTPKYTVIHSTVPMSTSKNCGAYHSPVRGVHPNLEKGMLTFVKYLAPKSEELKKYFERAGIKIELIGRPENTEALKIWSTTQYGVMIAVEKEIYKWCKSRGLDYDLIYAEANKTYNRGYMELGMGNVNRPVLKHIEGPIGGHCVTANIKFLEDNKLKSLIQGYE